MRIAGLSAAHRMARRDGRRSDIDGHIDEIALRPVRFGPPRRVRDDVDIVVREWNGWRIYVFEPADTSVRASLVYLHGGAWVHQIVKPHWRLVEQIAAEAHARVVVPIYPLVPFGTAEQVVPLVATLAAETDAERPCLIGDSAGGQIALSAAMQLRDRAREAPPRTVLISPALDVALRNPAIDDVDDPWIDRSSLREYGRWWQADLSDDDPRVSPLCGDFSGLGPMTVFSGTRDILNPDARALVEKARRCGVSVDFHEGRRMTHDYPLFRTSAGRQARRELVEMIGSHGL